MKILKWLSTLFLVSGAILVALNIPESKWGFIAFLKGHIILVYCFAKERDFPLLVQNVFFLVIDIVGIFYWVVV
jgi:hypothetical protein